MDSPYHTPDPTNQTFARTNRQTIMQRKTILRELLPDVRSIAEVCCGDCSQQSEIYQEHLGLERFCGLDISAEIVTLNRGKGIACIQGDALNKTILSQFLGFDVIFFGPPLSENCDGHTLLPFHQVTPAYHQFLELLFGDLDYCGTLVCICPKGTTLGDANQLYAGIRNLRADIALRLIHHSLSTLTGDGEKTEPRLKYIELWFSSQLPDMWEVRRSVSEGSSMEKKEPTPDQDGIANQA